MKKSLHMKILVPVDGSEFSNKALLQACNIAKNQQSQLSIIHIIEKPTLNFLDRSEYIKLVKKFGKKILSKAQKICTEQGIASKTILKEGNIVNEIIKIAKNDNYNLIVVGSKGLGAPARFILGSVSQKLAVNSPCSILIIK